MDLHAEIEVVTAFYAGTLDLTALTSLWVFDWLLTLEDEIKYAWPGRKSWAFWLFLANRYLPVPYIIWVNMVMFGKIDNWLVSCQNSRVFTSIYLGFVAIPVQLTIALRVYAATGKNRLLCSPLAFMMVAQGFWGVLLLIQHPQDIKLPEEIWDLFKLCVLQMWEPWSVGYFSLTLAFDIIAFSILIFSVKRELPASSLGITTLWNIILRDGTIYFVIVFLIQLFALLFLFTGPVSLRMLPSAMHQIAVPIMATRLMLSLKDAAANPIESWSHGTLSFRAASIVFAGNEDLRFEPHTFDTSGETLDVSTGRGEDDLELVPMP